LAALAIIAVYIETVAKARSAEFAVEIIHPLGLVGMFSGAIITCVLMALMMVIISLKIAPLVV